MSIYLVSYDLVNENSSHDYKPLYKRLKELNAHRVLYSQWLANLNNTPAEVRDHFKSFMDKDDRIWVTKTRKGEYTFSNAMGGTNDWLKENPPE